MDYAPTCGVNVSAHISPEAARVLIDAHEALQKLGFKPTLTLTLMPKPEPEPEPVKLPPPEFSPPPDVLRPR